MADLIYLALQVFTIVAALILLPIGAAVATSAIRQERAIDRARAAL